MRIVRLPEFRELPSGTFYVKAREPWAWGEPMVKGDTYSHDFVSMGVYEIECGDSNDLFGKWQAMLEDGVSFPLDIETGSRDGLFESDALFMIYEPDDLRKLRELIDAALTPSPAQP